ncbi:DsbA family oxidoreductase [Ectobacillus sp. sgz5001026]|uniref:DsbA family oxidoreductase n=1 Tax=Ectobacillus sp. sgz5001026 TaxID=3242473 RepID=UPI0036D41A36
MEVEVWSDIACPFCYIGKKRFDIALKQFDHKADVELVFKSFQLNPAATRGSKQNIHEAIASKYGVSVEQAKVNNEQISMQAKEIGLDFNMDGIVLTNTEAAHRVSHYAKEQGKMTEMMQRLMKAYFTDSLDVGEQDNLLKLAVEVGLDQEDVKRILEEGTYRNEVKEEQREAEELGVQGVPFFVFNRKYAVSGAQPVEVFLEVMGNVWKEEQNNKPLQVLGSNNDGVGCTDGSCNI